MEEIIKKGEVEPGEMLPPEEVLADELEVSRPTISKAISLLVRKSLVFQEGGKGTFVRGKEVKLTLTQELASFGEVFKRLRYVEKEPILLAESCLPYNLFPGLENRDFTRNYLYSLLEKKYNMPVIKTERCVRAVKALDEEAHFFKIPIGGPVIQLA